MISLVRLSSMLRPNLSVPARTRLHGQFGLFYQLKKKYFHKLLFYRQLRELPDPATKRMKLAILHYHLNRGGVTQVVANQLRALALAANSKLTEVTIFYGGRRTGWSDELPAQLGPMRLSLVEVPALEYDNQRVSGDLVSELQVALQRESLTAENCLVHVHNHALGKNGQLPSAITALATLGYRQLLQIHDFAEDFRPQDYQRLVETLSSNSSSVNEAMYPQAPQIHYATLNRRDHQLLTQAGIDLSRVHYLPNPVSKFPELPPRGRSREQLKQVFGVPTDRRFVLYPVRAIRRKNLGELLLWSAATPSTTYGVTLDPLNPMETPLFKVWRDLIDRLQLPVITGLGEANGLPFLENVAAADAFITTSVTEGFGMVFLESWLAGCPLIGRDLPEITADFHEAGMRFDAMAKRIDIPLSWLDDFDKLQADYRTAVNRVLNSFACPELSLKQTTAAFSQFIQSDCIDFACLDPDRQIRIITQVQQSAEQRKQFLKRNPVIDNSTNYDRLQCRGMIEENAKQAIDYSFENSGQRLWQIYEKLWRTRADEVTTLPGADSILANLLAPERLKLIRLKT